MSRTLHADVVSAIASGSYRYAHLVELQWDSSNGGTDYLTDAQFDIVDNSQTYTASAFLLSSTTVEESTKISTNSIQISISGVNQSYISALLALNYKYIDRKVVIKRVILGDTNLVVGESVIVFSGRISSFKINETLESSIVTLTVANHWEDFGRVNGRKSNPTHQSKVDPEDEIFEFCSGLKAEKITWGVGVEE